MARGTRILGSRARARPLGPLTDAGDAAAAPDEAALLVVRSPSGLLVKGATIAAAKPRGAVGPAPGSRRAPSSTKLAAGRVPTVSLVASGVGGGAAPSRAPAPPTADASPPRRAVAGAPPAAPGAGGWGARQAALATSLGVVAGFRTSPGLDEDECEAPSDDDDAAMAVDDDASSPDTPARPVGCVGVMASPGRALARR